MPCAESLSGPSCDYNTLREVERQSFLVNTAGVLLNGQDDVLSIPASEYRRTFDTNVFGAIEVCRAFVPDMVRGEPGM